MKTQGEIEAALGAGSTRFEQEYMGRGPKDLHAHRIGDLHFPLPIDTLSIAAEPSRGSSQLY